MARLLFRVVGVVAIGVAASACSSIPDWVDPTTWVSDKPPPAQNGSAPDLADIPGKPPTTTPDDQKQVAASLAADRAQANYSSEQLKAGADQSSTPPPPAPPPPSSDNSATPDSSKPSHDTADEPPPPPEKKGNAMFQAAQGHEVTDAAPQADQTPESKPTESPPSAKLQVASSNPSSAASQPDTLGFQTSSAPPVDPSVSQFVAPGTLSQYQQSASIGGTQSTPNSSAGAVQPLPGTPDAVISFAGDGTKLTPLAKARVREIAQAFQTKGASFVRVVGHSSSRTPNMSAEQHQQVVFQRSQDRANAVARELVKDGVPADKVLVEAVGDTQPLNKETMPKDEEGNRRAEIFLQS